MAQPKHINKTIDILIKNTMPAEIVERLFVESSEEDKSVRLS